MNRLAVSYFLVGVTLGLASCGGGESAVSASGSSPTPGCTGSCATSSIFLTTSDVERVLAQGIAEAHARGVDATIAVVDRVGNVLAVYRMGDPAKRSVLIASSVDSAANPILHSGLDGIRLPAPTLPAFNLDAQAAIAKAITGAYLSSEGNAFSTRTASQIIQEHFNVGVAHAPSGPLFGVQFSQLACSDFVSASMGAAAGAGPHRSPLGLAADPGGFPLYKNGTVVGGVGVMADGIYSLDKNVEDVDSNLHDEAVAYAASFSYLPPVDRRADQLTVDGITLRFSDADSGTLASAPGSASTIGPFSAYGSLIAVQGYADGQIHAGTAYGDPSSGVRPDASGGYAGQDAFVFVDGSNTPRYPAIAGSDGPAALTQTEAQGILSSALAVANITRAQIRLPLGETAQVNITVVDSLGNILGLVRTRDAPMFGADVAIQKARSVVFFSSSGAAALLQSVPDAKYLRTDSSGFPQLVGGSVGQSSVSLGDYVTAGRSFLGKPTFLADGAIAFSDRAIGDLSRPYFPDGIEGSPNGPFSKPLSAWSVFSTGLQLDLAVNAILQHVLYVASAGTVPDVSPGCVGVDFPANLAFAHAALPQVLANGLQIFPGSVPIYRGGTLVGAIGVSGDGVDQDDFIAFLGLQRALSGLGSSLSQAPATLRADTLGPQGTRLRYVQCPQTPFVNSTQQDACAND
jgi:uncharacterized protein GlcG (DUF336 family)